MRGTYSNLSLLPFYRQQSQKYSKVCKDCNTGINVPVSQQVPSFEIKLIDPPELPITSLVIDACSGEPVAFFDINVESITKPDGTEIYYFQYIPGIRLFPTVSIIGAPPTVSLGTGTYYVQIVFGGASPFSLYSDDWQVCDKDYEYKLKWSNDCVPADGEGSQFEQCLYLECMDWNRTQVENIEEVKVNSFGREVRSLVSTKFIDSFNILGNDPLFQTLSTLRGFDNVVLESLVTGEVIVLDEIDIQAAGEGCSFPLTISYNESTIVKDQCCNVLDLFGDPCPDDTTTEPDDCDNYNITINADLSTGLLTFNEAGNAGASSYIWLRDGVPVGTGTSISLGQYGTYTVQGTNGTCQDFDTFSYLDPCANMVLTVNASGATLYGNAQGDNNIVITICNSAGTEIGVGLPFTIPESQGDGNFTVKAVGDNCERQQSLFVVVTPPLICGHSASITYNSSTNLLTGNVTGCTGAIDSEFIQLEDENGTLTVVSSSNTHTVSQTANYWYNVTCDGCLVRVRKLVIIEDEEDCVKLCPDTCITVQIKDSGEDTKVTLPQ